MGDRLKISRGSDLINMNTIPIVFFGLVFLACLSVGTDNGDSQSPAEESLSIRKARYARARNRSVDKKKTKKAKERQTSAKKGQKAKERQTSAKKGQKDKGRQTSAKKGQKAKG